MKPIHYILVGLTVTALIAILAYGLWAMLAPLLIVTAGVYGYQEKQK